MDIIWDEAKNEKLFLERGLRFEELAELLLQGKYLGIMDNPARKGQHCFILPVNDYIHSVPFMIDRNSNIVLKTAYPSRKLHRQYGGRHEKQD